MNASSTSVPARPSRRSRPRRPSNNSTREKELRPEQKDFLDKMIQYYAESTQEGAATEQERSRQARAYGRMGRMNQILGRSQDSENAYRRAVALGQQLAADFPTRPEFRQELANNHNNLGVLLKATGRPTEAEAAYVEALAVYKQLAADFPDRPEFRQALAGTHSNLGNSLHDDRAAEGSGGGPRRGPGDSPATRRRIPCPVRVSAGPWPRATTTLATYSKRPSGRRKRRRPTPSPWPSSKQLVADFPDRPEFRLGLAK